jgi:hypothetical protein
MDQFGEIIQADSQNLVGECHQLYRAPAFASFIRASCAGSGRDYYAVVTGINTGPFDGNRVIQAHRLPPGELEERKPHLPSLLRTQFQARIAGYGESELRVPGTPPVPPRLHCWVYEATPEEIRDVTARPTFLRTLVNAPEAPIEDLLVGTITAARAAWGNQAPLVEWGKYLARLLRRDYVVLESVLQRLEPGPTLIPAPVVSTALEPAAPGWEKPIPLAGDPLPSSPPQNGGLRKYSSGQVDPFDE